MGHALAAAGYTVAVPEYRRAGMAQTAGRARSVTSRWPRIRWPGSPGRTAPIPARSRGGPFGGRSPRAVGRGPPRPAAVRGRVAVARTMPRHPRGLPGGLRLAAAVRGVEPGRGCGPEPDGRRAGRGPPNATPSPIRRRSRHPPVPVTLVHGTADEQVPAGISRAFHAGRLVEISRRRSFRPHRPGEPCLAPGHGGARGSPFRLISGQAAMKRKAGPRGPAFRKVAPGGNNPDRWSSVPCYGIALTEGHSTPGKTVVPKSRASKPAERPPRLVLLRTWASHPIMSRRTNRAAALIPRCRPEPDDQLGRYPAAVLNVDTLRLCPFTDFSGVQSAGRHPASGPRGPGDAAPPLLRRAAST